MLQVVADFAINYQRKSGVFNRAGLKHFSPLDRVTNYGEIEAGIDTADAAGKHFSAGQTNADLIFEQPPFCCADD